MEEERRTEKEPERLKEKNRVGERYEKRLIEKGMIRRKKEREEERFRMKVKWRIDKLRERRKEIE